MWQYLSKHIYVRMYMRICFLYIREYVCVYFHVTFCEIIDLWGKDSRQKSSQRSNIFVQKLFAVFIFGWLLALRITLCLSTSRCCFSDWHGETIKQYNTEPPETSFKLIHVGKKIMQENISIISILILKTWEGPSPHPNPFLFLCKTRGFKC